MNKQNKKMEANHNKKTNRATNKLAIDTTLEELLKISVSGNTKPKKKNINSRN